MVAPEDPHSAGELLLPTGPLPAVQVYPAAQGTHWSALERPDAAAAMVPAGQSVPPKEPRGQYWPMGQLPVHDDDV